MVNDRLGMTLGWVFILASISFAQMSVPGFVEVQNYHSSNTRVQLATETGSVYRKVYHHPNAGALRVVFGDCQLGVNDWIEVYSPTSKERHKLTKTDLIKWRGTSGFFNGDTIWIDLYLAPDSTGSFDIISYLVGLGGAISGNTAIGYQTLCGIDDRVASPDNRCARFVTNNTANGGNCTVWLGSADGCAITAGHCFTLASLMLAEFDCPPSLADGTLQHPPIANQFPLDTTSVTFVDGALGDDWAVCKLHTNIFGQTAQSLYGYYDIVTATPSLSDPLRVNGFGVDSGVQNATNQTDSGPLLSVIGSLLNYQVDTTGGNSGGPIINDTTGKVVGIHTDGGCTVGGTGNNKGTSTKNVGFQAALAASCTVIPAVPIASFDSLDSSVLVGDMVSFLDTSSGIPTSWDWDFDGDMVTDATTATPNFQFTMPGVYDVRLTVTNSLGMDTKIQRNLITVHPIVPASLPYTQDFSGGLPATGEWFYSSEGDSGRIQATGFGSESPISGSPSLAMDSFVEEVFATNSSTLFLDLANKNPVILSFWFKETGDEAHPEDGVFLSDGLTEIQLIDLGNGPQDWTEMTVDISAVAATAGMTLTSTMRIIFRQRDNYGIPSDGHLIDDVRVTEPDSGQANSAATSLMAVGMVDQDGIPPLLDQAGPFFVDVPVGSYLDLSIQGPPLGFMVMFAGPLNRANANFPGNGQLDLGLLGPGDFSDISVVIDALNPTSLVDLFGILTATGQQRFAPIISSVFPPGSSFALQVLVTPGLQLTAAIEVTIQ